MNGERKNIQADLDEQVCERGVKDWLEAWHRWYLGIPENRHPTLSHSSYERRQDQEQGKLSLLGSKELKAPKKCDSKVWFLTGGYQEKISTRSYIPPGNYYVLAPIYASWASTDEYPSLNSVEELNDFCERDIKDVKLTAILDGQDLSPDQIKIDKPFSVDLPAQNILGLKVMGKRGKRTIKIVSNGYWIWLKPLPIGDHKLHLHGSSPSFDSELNLSLSVAGPEGQS